MSQISLRLDDGIGQFKSVPIPADAPRTEAEARIASDEAVRKLVDNQRANEKRHRVSRPRPTRARDENE